jgi:hypothetical protein
MPTVYPSSYTGSSAILMARNRTGQVSGQPTDTTILSFLNAALESVERRVGAIRASTSEAIAQGATSVSTPSDLQSIINVNFTIVLPTAQNAILYPIRLMQEGAFERATGYMPGLSGGYPTVGFIATDASNVMTLQVFPAPTVAGFINFYYIQRPQMWVDTGTSVVQLDSMVQEAVICWTCRAISEGRGMYDKPVTYFNGLYEKAIAELQEDYNQRVASGMSIVADVMNGPSPSSISPDWVEW